VFKKKKKKKINSSSNGNYILLLLILVFVLSLIKNNSEISSEAEFNGSSRALIEPKSDLKQIRQSQRRLREKEASRVYTCICMFVFMLYILIVHELIYT